MSNFLATHWINGQFEMKWLRHIDYHTKTQAVSNCQWVGEWDADEKLKKKVYGDSYKKGNSNTVFTKWKKHATRFRYEKIYTKRGQVKMTQQGERVYSRIQTRLDNPDGHLVITPVIDMQQLQCNHSFATVFEGKYVHEVGSDLNHWNRPLIEYLIKLFNRERIYCLSSFHPEMGSVTNFLEKNMTYFHITKFTNNKQYATFDETYHNRTIGFWLFPDCLVYGYINGIDTW